MAYFKITQNKKGKQQAKIQVSGKDIATGKNKLYTKRVYNDDGLSEAKFRKFVEKCAIEFEEDVARAYREGTAAVLARVLTFPELMNEWMAHVKSDFSISYYGRADTARKKFFEYLKEHKLYDKPVTEITVRDVQMFFNQYLQKTYTRGDKVKLRKPLPDCIAHFDVHRKCGVSSNSLYKVKNGKSVKKSIAEKICATYGLSLPEYFDEEAQPRQRYAYETVNGYRKILSTVFEEAVRYDWIHKNPVRYTKISNIFDTGEPVTEKEIFSLAEAKEFIKHLDELPKEKINIKITLKFMLLTGVRNAEMCGLRWSDIDFDSKTVSIRRNRLYSSEKGVYEKSPKTKSSKRDIPLPDVLIDDLKEYMEWFEEADENFRSKLNEYYLAVNDRREPIHPFTNKGWLTDIEKKYNMKHVTRHGLRHTYCSLLLSQYVPIQTVSKYMGHSNSTITLRVYSHFVPDTQTKAVTVLNNLTDE
ncbi:MAG: site-specific integrase [Roseburia sp.]|nr:site-specific integrase [Roseburia sp.]